MDKNSLIDYCSCILFRSSAALFRKLPIKASLFLGVLIGELLYRLDYKHRAIAYSNIKAAFKEKLQPAQIRNIIRRSYRAFGQNLIEIFLIPLVDQEYIDKYIQIEGLDHIKEGLKKGKGVILVTMHEGNWELSGIICANLEFPLNLFIRGQRHPRLDRLLNSYRRKKIERLIHRENQVREIVRAIDRNEVLGITIDQGGKAGVLVNFFGREAAMASGAVRLALKYDSVVIPVFSTRIKGPYVKIFVGQPFVFKKTGNLDKDIQENLQRLVSIFEKYILQYPQEYLWTYKLYKYARQKNILVISDGKTGHLRQSQAVAKMACDYFTSREISPHIDCVEVKFKDDFSRLALALSSCLSGRYNCQGCLWCLKKFLKADIYESLINKKFDVVISCGSSLAGINFIISRENLAKSITLMRPSFLSTKRFDLVVIPEHDRPKSGKNIVVTEGALNLIDEDSVKSQAAALAPQAGFEKKLVLGLLLGGDTKNFKLSAELLRPMIARIKLFSEKHHAEVLITTSRRTNRETEQLIKKEFGNYPHSKLLVIANEKNIPEAIGMILGRSSIVIVSPESISMISEAASSGRYVVVFKSQIDTRHDYFLNYLAKKKYIYLCGPFDILQTLEKLLRERPQIKVLKDRLTVENALKKIL